MRCQQRAPGPNPRSTLETQPVPVASRAPGHLTGNAPVSWETDCGTARAAHKAGTKGRRHWTLTVFPLSLLEPLCAIAQLWHIPPNSHASLITPMGKGDKGKGQLFSSAKAAEALASKGGGGFGG